MTGVLQGYRVLEFGEYIASQVLGMLLADQGAEVVKLEPPHGSRMRGSAAFAVWNRSKKSVILDPSIDGTSDVIAELATTADVLICDSETLPQNVGIAEIQTANPRLVTVCLPAFGADHGKCLIAAARNAGRARQRAFMPTEAQARQATYQCRTPAYSVPSQLHPPSSPPYCIGKQPEKDSASICPSTTQCLALWARR